MPEIKIPLVEVTWLDAMTEEAHIHREAVNALVPIQRRNVGYLLKLDDDSVVLCYGILENLYKGKTAFDMVMVIPKGMVLDVRKLK